MVPSKTRENDYVCEKLVHRQSFTRIVMSTGTHYGTFFSLLEYGENLEQFKQKETANLTMEEMKSSSSLLNKLHKKLQEAKAEYEEINRDEQLLGWSQTSAPALACLIEYIEPYHQLWHVAYNFHIQYDIWFHGNFIADIVVSI